MNQINGKIPPLALAFDIDGVLADTFRTFVQIARGEYGIALTYEEIVEYDFLSVVDMDARIAYEIVGRILASPLEVGIAPMAGAMETLRRLISRGSVLLVTARPNPDAILAWVHHHLGSGFPGAVRVEATGTHLEKIPILQRAGIRYFVEDRLDTCFLLKEAGIQPIVFDQPWNRKPHPFPRVSNWDEIARLIDWQGPWAPKAGGRLPKMLDSRNNSYNLEDI